MAYYFAPPTGLTPGYPAPMASAYQQVPPGYVVIPQHHHSMTTAYPMPPTGLTPGYALPPTGLTPGYAIQPRAPAVMTPGYYHPHSQYQHGQPQVWPGDPSLAPSYRTGMTPGYRSGVTLAGFIRPGQTPVIPQRPVRPGLAPGREPSYFRSYPGRAGQTPAAARTPAPGLRPSGTPAKPTPGPSRLREVILNEHEQLKDAKDSQFFTDILKHLERLEGKGKGKGPEAEMAQQLREFIELYFEHDKHRHAGADAEKKPHDQGHVTEAEKEKSAAKAKTAEQNGDAEILNSTPSIFVEAGDVLEKEQH